MTEGFSPTTWKLDERPIYSDATARAPLDTVLPKATIDIAVHTDAIKRAKFERLIVDSAVQEKAVAFPTDSRLLEMARHKLVKAAKAVEVNFEQTFAKEGKMLWWKIGGYAVHARQYRRLKKMLLRRQRTIARRLIREE